MNLTERIDGYCERVDFTFWAEPVNAVTNLAFIVAALIMWRRSAGVPLARALAAILFAIGIGSFLFHTLATVWAAMADTLPILAFILLYLFAVHRDVLGWPAWAAVLATAGFLPYAAGVTVLLQDVPFFGVSSFYWTVPILLVIYGAMLWRRFPVLMRGFLIGAGILSLSITARSLDEPLCATFPVGTHLFWHLLNAVMLGWMIEIYRRHMLEGGAAGR
ncbi:ceramidase domain-containing protein [Salibaculum griseiflavum]|uniref:Ceramidase n=1 Tax=Salibaculum griseiflavum TaxID=1914409 RepID=A0A2V1P3I0_9RHOB|nr:ceramidase domain-containing protein [Salibaculum griseiflavum]PWG15872.1 hypothetical protein DFK10_14560 [Salibaculum griseiflavum]